MSYISRYIGLRLTKKRRDISSPNINHPFLHRDITGPHCPSLFKGSTMVECLTRPKATLPPNLIKVAGRIWYLELELKWLWNDLNQFKILVRNTEILDTYHHYGLEVGSEVAIVLSQSAQKVWSVTVDVDVIPFECLGELRFHSCYSSQRTTRLMISE